MAGTDIKNTWGDYKSAGEKIEDEFLRDMKYLYPTMYKIGGNYKYADFVVPEKGGLQIEIKRDYKSHDTGNFAFEYMFKGKKSGLAATNAEVFIMVDRISYFLFKAKPLKEFINLNFNYLKQRQGGDNNYSQMVLVPKGVAANNGFCTVVGRNPLEVDYLHAFFNTI